jgi:sulfur carrier protein
MNVIINGEKETVSDGLTLAELVSGRMRTDKGVAAAVDGAVAPRSTWSDLVLQDGAAIELLTAVQGG